MEDRNATATRGDLLDLESRVNERFATIDERFARIDERFTKIDERVGKIEESIEIVRSEANHMYRDIVERISDSQTEVLKAFYSFAQSNNRRVLEVEGNESALRGRVGTLEDRVLEIEKRLNIPPAA